MVYRVSNDVRLDYLCKRIGLLTSLAAMRRPAKENIDPSVRPDELLALPRKNFHAVNLLFPREPIDIAKRPMRRDVCHREGILHLTAHVLLFNEKSELFLQGRHPIRRHTGGRISASAGGHMNFETSSEPAETAVIEMMEEALGGDKWFGVARSLEEIARYRYRSESGRGVNNEYVSLFIGRFSGEADPDHEEADWMAPFRVTDVLFLMKARPNMFSNNFGDDIRWLKLAWHRKGSSGYNLLRSLSLSAAFDNYRG